MKTTKIIIIVSAIVLTSIVNHSGRRTATADFSGIQIPAKTETGCTPAQVTTEVPANDCTSTESAGSFTKNFNTSMIIM